MYLYKHAYVVVISGIDLEYTASHSKILKDGLGVRLAEEAWRVHVATYGYGDRSLGEVIGLCRVVHAHSQLQHACTLATTTRMYTRNYNTHALSQLQHACTLATTTRTRTRTYNTHALSQLQHACTLATTTRMRTRNYNTHALSQLQHACALTITTRMRSHNYNTHAHSQLQHARTDDVTTTFDDRKCLLGTVHVQCTSRRHH